MQTFVVCNVVRFAFCKDILQQNAIAFCILLQNAQPGKMGLIKLTSIKPKMGQIRVVGCFGAKILSDRVVKCFALVVVRLRVSSNLTQVDGVLWRY